VTLILTNSRGCTDTLKKTGYISVGNTPIVDFTVDTTRACVSTTLNFTNLSTGGDSWLWLFGDNDTAQSFNASHNFGALGKLYVGLIGSDRGCKDTLFRQDYVEILPPLPVIGLSEKRVCRTPATISFNNLSIGATSFLWNFGNGDTSTQHSLSYTYQQEGTYGVSLTVRNDSTGCVATSSDSVRIVNLKADFVPDTTRGCVPKSIQFIDSSYNAIKWAWNFGTGRARDTSNLANPQFRFRKAGVYDVELIVTNSLKCQDTLKMDSLIHVLEAKADFAIDNSSQGCVPLFMQFKDLSSGTGPISKWKWDFGDGDSAVTQNPLHVYTTPNRYTVKLNVEDVDGCTSSITKTDMLFVTQPAADFTADHPINCTDNPITFVSMSTGVGLSYFWDFGDGNTSILANPSHSYAQPGNYNVSLRVMDVNGCDSTLIRANYIQIQDLNAFFTADTTQATCPPLSVTFSPQNTFIHPNLSWQWDFGNGATSSQVSPIHNYTQAGTYDVSLILFAPSGCIDTFTRTQYIRIFGPTGSFLFTPKEGCPGTQVSFTGSSPDLVTYQWIYGDGSSGAGQQTTYTYNQSGIFAPTLAITDSGGCTVYLNSPDSVEIYDIPSVDFVSSQRVICEAGLINFQDFSQGSLTGATYHWSFGDGDTSNLQNPSHQYTNVGSYTVRLQVTTADGCEATEIKNAWITVAEPPQAGMVLEDTLGCAPFGLTAVDTSNGGSSGVISRFWSFGNGNTANGDTVQTRFAQGGNYVIQVTVLDRNGCADSVSSNVRVLDGPDADFYSADTLGCAPWTASFLSLSPDAVRWQWSFGDGSTDSVANPFHPYAANGTYDVTLVVWDAAGCSDTLVRPDYVKLRLPTAEFAVKDTVACPGTFISFTDQSRSDTTFLSWQWDFGDGNTGQGAAVGHSYDQSGRYSVQMVVFDALGCSDTVVRSNLIRIQPDIQPEVPRIHYATVLDDETVELAFHPVEDSIDDFSHYNLYRKAVNGTFQLVRQINERMDTLLSDQGLNTLGTHYCYLVEAVNQCGTPSDFNEDEAHCTIELKTFSFVDMIDLNWTPYTGWGGVSEYRIYRVEDYSTNGAELLAVVDGSTTAYLDEDMNCYQDFTYRIEAIPPPGGRYLAKSDTANARPYHPGPQNPMNMVRATVENNDYVLVEWKLPKIEGFAGYVLERDAGKGFEEILQHAVGQADLKFQDTMAQVNDQSYRYRTFGVDSCGDYTPLGRPATSVNLAARRTNGSAELNWNPYDGWLNGVSHYEIQVLNIETGEFELVEEVEGNATQYIDRITDLNQVENCYRIFAHEQGGNQVVSLSNEACVLLEPRMFTANAFSPNGDGRNDVFTVGGAFLSEFNLKIYNRWGRLVHETDNQDEQWDGRCEGIEVPEGVYVFSVRGKGHNGDIIQRSGTITLIR
ncbi:MAG: PKD domain-containing protein, partial [Bacteroidota bacterium]